MKLTSEEHTLRVAVLTPLERLDAFTAPDLRAEGARWLEIGVGDFVIDLSQTPFLDSAGMAALVQLLKRARDVGGSVKLVWPKKDEARRILHLTKFDRVFTMIDVVSDGLPKF